MLAESLVETETMVPTEGAFNLARCWLSGMEIKTAWTRGASTKYCLREITKFLLSARRVH